MTTYNVKTFEELEAIAQSAQLVLCISGDRDLTALDIADISEGPTLAEWHREALNHGRTFVGIVALTGGAVAAHLVEPLEVPAIEMLSAATVSHVSRRYLQAVSRLGLPGLTGLVSAPAATESGVN